MDKYNLQNRLFSLQRISIIYVIIIAALVGAAFWLLKDIVANQSYKQQQAFSPILTLVDQEVLRPVHIAKALAAAGVYQPYFDTQQFSDTQIIDRLAQLQSRFDIGFYIANEKTRKQYNSDGSTFELVEGKVGWYFELQQEPSDFLAVLGKREDVHLYIDVKQYDEQGNFIGFAGVSKSLREFLLAFKRFNQAYGIQFIFANNKQQILLASDPQWTPDALNLHKTQQLPWYSEYQRQQQTYSERTKLLNMPEGDILVSQISIELLDWQLYIISPMTKRQSELNRKLIYYLFALLIVIYLSYRLVRYIVRDYIQSIDQKVNFDPLTQLANRHYLQESFNQMRKRHARVGIIIVDIDHFKQINDQYGHNAGDLALQMVAQCLQNTTRKSGLAGRWGGDEFIVLLNDADLNQTVTIANQIQHCLQQEKIYLSQSSFEIEASYGVTSTEQPGSLEELIDIADRALYQAKNEGRNRICYLAV